MTIFGYFLKVAIGNRWVVLSSMQWQRTLAIHEFVTSLLSFQWCSRFDRYSSTGAAAPTLVVLKSSPNVERVVVQLIGLVDYMSLKMSVWCRCLLSRRPLWTHSLMLHPHLPETNCSNGCWLTVRRTEDGLCSDNDSSTVSSCDFWLRCAQSHGRIHSKQY